MQKSTAENPVKTPLKILIIGQPGSRKTTLGLQFPNVHVIDCDRNLVGPETHLRSHGYALEYTIDPIRYDSSGAPREIHQCYDAVVDVCKRAVPGRDAEYDHVKTLFVDSLSHVNEFIIRKVLKLKIKESMEPNHWTDFKSWAYSLLVSKLEETNRTILCSAHEIKLTENDKTNIMQARVIGYEPFFQGKVGDTIGAFFTDVWRLEKRDGSGGRVEWWLQTDKTPKCEYLKNSVGMPNEINLTEGAGHGYHAIAGYLKGKI